MQQQSPECGRLWPPREILLCGPNPPQAFLKDVFRELDEISSMVSGFLIIVAHA